MTSMMGGLLVWCGVVGGHACIQEFSSDLIIVAFAKAFDKSTRSHTGGYYINSITMGTSSLGRSSPRGCVCGGGGGGYSDIFTNT